MSKKSGRLVTKRAGLIIMTLLLLSASSANAWGRSPKVIAKIDKSIIASAELRQRIAEYQQKVKKGMFSEYDQLLFFAVRSVLLSMHGNNSLSAFLTPTYMVIIIR